MGNSSNQLKMLANFSMKTAFFSNRHQNFTVSATKSFINFELEQELLRNASFGIWDYVWLVQWSTEKDWFVYTTWICTCNKCVRKVADLEFDIIEYKPLQSIDMETSVKTDMYFQQYADIKLWICIYFMLWYMYRNGFKSMDEKKNGLTWLIIK